MKLLTLIPLLFAFHSGSTLAAQLSVDLVPDGNINSVLTTESSFDIDILLHDTTDFAGFEFDLSFDSTLLSATSITSGDIFGLDTFPLNDTISSGNISFSEASLALTGLNINTPSVLATISFDVIASGISTLSLANVILSDSLGFELSPVNLVSGVVTTVPVPAAFWLFFTGLVGISRIAKKS